jgi:hypothetical protein
MRLRHFHRQHRRWNVAPRRPPVPDPVQVVPQLGLEVLDRAVIHPGAPLFALTFSHAAQTSHFEITNGLPDDFSSSTRLLPDPGPVDRTNTPRTTRPLGSTPLRGLPRYYEPVRRPTPQRSLSALRLQPLAALPVATRRSCLGWRCRDRPSHVPRESRRPGSRRLHAGHRLASKRAPARLILGPPNCPSFDAVCVSFRHLSSDSLAFAFLVPT